MVFDSERDIKCVLVQHPKLTYNEDSKCFTGALIVSGDDEYEVKIDISNIPHRLPVLYELGDRIPNKPDRHKYDGTDICCVTTRAMGQVLLKKEIKSLLDYIHRLAIPYLQNNSFYELNGKYVMGEYSHGLDGVVEAYFDILNIHEIHAVLYVMKSRLNGVKIRIHDPCYCGSGKKLKSCGNHDTCYRLFRLIDVSIIEVDCRSLLTSIGPN
jgi:hypothetical protein